MGLSASFVVQRDGAGWVNRESWPVDAAGLEDLAGTGPSVAARVLHSDACFVIGRAPGMPDWRWIFGEDAVRAYDDEFDPIGWDIIDDPDDAEDSRDERIQATVPRLVAWALASGLVEPDSEAVSRILAAGYLLAEEGFFTLIEVLGIDAPLVEMERQSVSAPSEPAAWLLMPPSAIAIDHSSPVWHEINAGHLLGRFGEPPCVLRWHAGQDFVMSEPPVCIGGGREFPGEWIAVPERHLSDFYEAADWARKNVGQAGEAPSGSRPLLVLDDPPRHFDDNAPERIRSLLLPSRLHSIAENAKVAVRFELAEPLNGAVAGDLAKSLYDRLVAATVASVGEVYSVTYGEELAAKGWGLLVDGWTSRPGGHTAATKATPAAWNRVVAKLRSDQITGAEFSISRTGAYAGRMDEGCMAARFSVGPEDLWSDGPPAWVLTVSADLPFFGGIFRPEDAAALTRLAVNELPLRRGWVHVGRWEDSADHWIDVIPTAEVPATTSYAIIERHGGLSWLQRATEPPSAILEVFWAEPTSPS